MHGFPPEKIVEIDAVAFEDAAGKWFAQCIQVDIAAHAHSLPSLAKALERQIAANILINEKAGRSGLEGIPSAPERYIEAFRTGYLSFTASYKMKNVSNLKRVHLHDIKVLEEPVY